MPQQMMNIIDGYISSYCFIFNSAKQLNMIKQANEFSSFICDIESERLREKDDGKNKAMNEEDQRNKKSEQKQIRDDDDRLKCLDNCGGFGHSVLEFGMNNLNNLKVKEIRACSAKKRDNLLVETDIF